MAAKQSAFIKSVVNDTKKLMLSEQDEKLASIKGMKIRGQIDATTYKIRAAQIAKRKKEIRAGKF